MVRRPPNFRGKIVAVLAQRFDRDREQNGLADRSNLRLEALLRRLVPEGGEIGRDHHAGDDFAIRLFERGDLRREVVGEILIAAGIGQREAELVEDRREADLLAAPGVAVTIIGEQSADRFVGADLLPHVGEDADDVFETPEEMIRVVEGLPRRRAAGRIGLPADEVRLPRRDRRDARHLLDFALRGDRVGGFRRRCHQHKIDFVGDDQLFGDFAGAVGVGLTVLHRDFDRQRGAADFDAAFHLLEKT